MVEEFSRIISDNFHKTTTQRTTQKQLNYLSYHWSLTSHTNTIQTMLSSDLQGNENHKSRERNVSNDQYFHSNMYRVKGRAERIFTDLPQRPNLLAFLSTHHQQTSHKLHTPSTSTSTYCRRIVSDIDSNTTRPSRMPQSSHPASYWTHVAPWAKDGRNRTVPCDPLTQSLGGDWRTPLCIRRSLVEVGTAGPMMGARSRWLWVCPRDVCSGRQRNRRHIGAFI
jgi:hypothetical protein